MGFLQIFAAILTEEAILYTLSFLQGYKFVEYQNKCHKGLQIEELLLLRNCISLKTLQRPIQIADPMEIFLRKK